MAIHEEYKYNIMAKVQYVCIDCGKLSSLRFPSGFSQPQRSYRCESCALKRWYSVPENMIKSKRVREKMYQDPKWRANVLMGVQKRIKNPVAIQNFKESRKRMVDDPVWQENLLISASGTGFWYGHRSICPENRQKKYCEKWRKDLWVRIDAAWDYKSAISGKTKFENYRQAHLDRHHVYWQEKSCCEWDEDAKGYYAIINLGTKAKPNMYKHYIKGDPNKFVLLTHREHKMVRGNKKLGTSKLTWIKYFEDMIEKRELEGKPCYLSHEDYEIYKVKNADTISFYNPVKLKQKHISKVDQILIPASTLI